MNAGAGLAPRREIGALGTEVPPAWLRNVKLAPLARRFRSSLAEIAFVGI
jgi:hypothetical protein